MLKSLAFVTFFSLLRISSSLNLTLLPSSSFSCNVDDEGSLKDDRLRLDLEFLSTENAASVDATSQAEGDDSVANFNSTETSA